MTNTAPTTDYRDLRPKGRRASDPEQIRDDSISALDYGKLCVLLSREQARLAGAVSGSRADWIRIDARCQAFAEACSIFSGIPADELRRRLAPHHGLDRRSS